MRRAAFVALLFAGLLATVGSARPAYACLCGGEGPVGISETFTGRLEKRVGDRFTFVDVNDVPGESVSLDIVAWDYPDPNKKFQSLTSCDLAPPQTGGTYRVTWLKYSETISLCGGGFVEVAAPPPGTPQLATEPSRAWIAFVAIPIGALIVFGATFALRKRRA